ncbi:MAG: hypothetical protein KJ621_08295 [Proteobacteria bacterium]|nr:hypothetical protein [Pseudomonadota bacterium]MBU1741384.1 hypothetical protein [Pseudomonadota bacterium]
MARINALCLAVLLAAGIALPGAGPAAEKPTAQEIRHTFQKMKFKDRVFNRLSFGLLSRQDGVFRLEIKNRSIYIVDVAVIKVYFFDRQQKFLSRAYGLLFDLGRGKAKIVRLVNFFMQPRKSKYFYVRLQPISLSHSATDRVASSSYQDYRRLLYPVYHQRGKYLPLPGCGECDLEFSYLF